MVARALSGDGLFDDQQYIADVALEIRADGSFFHPTVGVQAARQNGKTRKLIWPRLMLQAVRSPGSQSAYTAQSRELAREKLVELHDALVQSPLRSGIRKLVTANGRERLTFVNGSSIRIFTPSKKGGRGPTLDLVVIDEAGEVPIEVLQSIGPTMTTRRSSQLWVVSNAGVPDESVMLQRLRTRGVASLQSRAAPIAWFEWSPPEDANPFERATWLLANPNLDRPGGPTSVSLQEALENMELHQFKREHLNLWALRAAESIFTDEMWGMVADDTMAPDPARVVFGVCVAQERHRSAIAAASKLGDRVVVEIVRVGAGTGWVEDELRRLARTYGAQVVIDAGSQAGTMIDTLGAEDDDGFAVDVVSYTSREYARACAAFFDLVVQERLAHRRDHRLDTALDSVSKRPLGGGWAWDMRTDADVTPLVAATLAARQAELQPDDADLFIYS
jgi:hypothetical protein